MQTPTSAPNTHGTTKSPSSNTTPIRINKTTARLLKSLLMKSNKLPLGKRVKADQIIARALELITDEHLNQIKEATYDSEDRLKIEHKRYCEAHGAVSKEEFLIKLLDLSRGIKND